MRIIPVLLTGGLLFFSSPGSGGPPFLVWLALVPLLLAIRDLPWHRAAAWGLLSGLLYYLPLLYWITIVLGRYGGVHPLAALVALGLLALYMSLYLALFCGLAVTLTGWGQPGRPGPKLLWAAPVIWVALDLIRAWLFTGFPWQDLGYSQYQYPALLQVAELTGHHGLTFVIVLTNTLVATLLAAALERKRGTGGRPDWLGRLGQLGLISPAGALLLLAAFFAYGLLRLPQVEAGLTRAPTLRVSVIQGNIPQEEKWDYSYQSATVARYLELSGQAAAGGSQLMVWPETALPFYPLENNLLHQVAAFATLHDTTLLIGAPHRERAPEGARGHDDFRYFNSALLLTPGQDPSPDQNQGRDPSPTPNPTTTTTTTTNPDPRKQIRGFYYKQHLVPFGEYIPLRRLLPFFAPVVETLGDFSPGPGPVLLEHRDQRLGVLICFEAIFPRLARQLTEQGADLLINITNDAWFGPSNAPDQHLAMTVLRAVENRRAVARAANTGISAFITPAGRIEQATPLFVAAQRSADLPLPPRSAGPASPPATSFFTAGGHLFAPACLLWLMAGIVGQIYGRVHK